MRWEPFSTRFSMSFGRAVSGVRSRTICQVGDCLSLLGGVAESKSANAWNPGAFDFPSTSSGYAQDEQEDITLWMRKCTNLLCGQIVGQVDTPRHRKRIGKSMTTLIQEIKKATFVTDSQNSLNVNQHTTSP